MKPEQVAADSLIAAIRALTRSLALEIPDSRLPAMKVNHTTNVKQVNPFGRLGNDGALACCIVGLDHVGQRCGNKPFWSSFYHENDRFTKTGLGQTLRKRKVLEKEVASPAGPWRWG